MDSEKGYYTMRQLCERYGCVRSTMYRKMREDDYPRPKPFGKGGKLLWSQDESHQWESIHLLTSLRAAAGPRAEDQDAWDIRRAKAMIEGLAPRRHGRPLSVPATLRKPKRSKRRRS